MTSEIAQNLCNDSDECQTFKDHVVAIYDYFCALRHMGDYCEVIKRRYLQDGDKEWNKERVETRTEFLSAFTIRVSIGIEHTIQNYISIIKCADDKRNDNIMNLSWCDIEKMTFKRFWN